MNVLFVDAYDSFSSTIVYVMRGLGAAVTVVQCDEIPMGCITHPWDRIVLGPGPGTPKQAGYLKLLEHWAGHQQILGICLGHQAIGQYFGSPLKQLEPVHGRLALIHHKGNGLFTGLPSPVPMTRYHSLGFDELSDCLVATARTADAIVMALQHRELPVAGVQFHPESVLSGCHGKQLLAHYLKLGIKPLTTPAETYTAA